MGEKELEVAIRMMVTYANLFMYGRESKEKESFPNRAGLLL